MELHASIGQMLLSKSLERCAQWIAGGDYTVGSIGAAFVFAATANILHESNDFAQACCLPF
jgi:hypothetical protein